MCEHILNTKALIEKMDDERGEEKIRLVACPIRANPLVQFACMLCVKITVHYFGNPSSVPSVVLLHLLPFLAHSYEFTQSFTISSEKSDP